MTELLRLAIASLVRLPAVEQDCFARRIISELAQQEDADTEQIINDLTAYVPVRQVA